MEDQQEKVTPVVGSFSLFAKKPLAPNSFIRHRVTFPEQSAEKPLDSSQATAAATDSIGDLRSLAAKS